MNNKPTQYDELRISKFIPGIAWFFLILIAISIPGHDLPQFDSWFTQISFDKLIHTGLFAVLAFLFMYPLLNSSFPGKEKRNYLVKITIATCLYGIVTEIIQKYYVPGRSFDLYDVAADCLGCIIALLFTKTPLSKKLILILNKFQRH